MLITRLLKLRRQGFAAFSVLIALSVFAVFAGALAVFSATNQTSRTYQLQALQSYYVGHAAAEYALRQIYVDGNMDPISARDFGGLPFSINRQNGKINIAILPSKGPQTRFSITDPIPPNGVNCLNVNTSAAAVNTTTKRLTGVGINRKINCTQAPIIITSMIISWSPNSSYRVLTIDIGSAPLEYNNATGLGSGSTFTFASAYTINTGSPIAINSILWNNIGSRPNITLTFNFSDGGAKTVSFVAG